jgi:hypothetical protein
MVLLLYHFYYDWQLSGSQLVECGELNGYGTGLNVFIYGQIWMLKIKWAGSEFESSKFIAVKTPDCQP